MNPPLGGRRAESEGTPPALPLYEPAEGAGYTLEAAAAITGVASQTILLYEEHGLLAPLRGAGEVRFDDEALRTLRRIERLRAGCAMSLGGVRLVLSLLDEVERLSEDLRRYRR